MRKISDLLEQLDARSPEDRIGEVWDRTEPRFREKLLKLIGFDEEAAKRLMIHSWEEVPELLRMAIKWYLVFESR